MATKSEKKVKFADIEEDPVDAGNLDEQSERCFNKKFKHTLDSDEEDDEVQAEQSNVLDPEYLEGEEEGRVKIVESVKITPFNMREELEEGHFDKEGSYVFHRNKDEVKDFWLENIDLFGIKELPKKDKDDNAEDEEEPEVDVKKCYEEIAGLLKPGESVQKAIQRLGKSTKLTHKGKNVQGGAEIDMSVIEEAKTNLSKLISLADSILHTGVMDIYEKTYEEINFHLKNSIGDNKSLDMFGDDFEAKKDDKKSLNDEVMWEFKWDNEENSKVYGPHSSSEMLDWVNSGYFEAGVWVREIGKADAQFYNSKRIDFELYM